VLRDLLMPVMLKALTRSGKMSQNWLFEYHIDWEAPVQPEARAA
jgi:hypothetical protein